MSVNRPSTGLCSFSLTVFFCKRLPVTGKHVHDEESFDGTVHIPVFLGNALQPMLGLSVPDARQSLEQQLLLRDGVILIAQAHIEGFARLFAAGEKISSRPAAFAQVSVSDALQLGNAFDEAFFRFAFRSLQQCCAVVRDAAAGRPRPPPRGRKSPQYMGHRGAGQHDRHRGRDWD